MRLRPQCDVWRDQARDQSMAKHYFAEVVIWGVVICNFTPDDCLYGQMQVCLVCMSLSHGNITSVTVMTAHIL